MTTPSKKFVAIHPGHCVAVSATLESLFQVIDLLPEVEGTQKTYTPAELKEIIEDVRTGKKNIRWVTRTFGLRDKVAELLNITME